MIHSVARFVTSAVIRAPFLLMVLCVAGWDSLSAQEAPVGPGTRVRVQAPPSQTKWVRGTVSAWADGSLVLQPEDPQDASPLTLAWDQITRLEVHRGRKSAAGKGALIGLVGGAVAGFGLALIACEGWTEDCIDYGVGTIAIAVLTVPVGAAGGAAIGAVIGRIVGTDRWVRVATDRIQVSVTPTMGGQLGLVLSVGF